MNGCLRSEKGAVLIIVEIFAVLLIVFAGLAIDSTLLATSKAQQRHIVEYVALKAISEYITSPAATYDLKLEDARHGAEKIARVNVYIGRSFLVNPGAVDDVSMVSSSTNVNNPASPNGRITPGRWHFAQPAICAPSPSGCPCDSSGNWRGSCFEPLDMEDPANVGVVPSAFKAELWTKDTSPLRALLMSIQGETTIKLSSEATAAMFQRHGVFLLDLSRSVASETHVPFESTDGGSAGRRRGVTMSADPAYQVDPTSAVVSCAVDCRVSGSCQMVGGLFAGQANHFWNFVLSPTRGVEPPIVPMTRHYRSDYTCHNITVTEDGAAPYTSLYMIDTRRGNARDAISGAVFPYDGPEPLTSLLYGLNYGVNLMRTQNVPGDLVGFLGFDRSAGVAERRVTIRSPQDAVVTSLLSATNVSVPNFTQRYVNRVLFPRLGAGANLEEPLRLALDELIADPNARNSENFVILMSNGLPSCAAGRVCDKSEAGYRSALADAESVLRTGYQPNGVKFHFLQVGDAVRPHTLLAKSLQNPNRCMREDESRMAQQKMWFVDFHNNNSPFTDAVTERTDNFFYHPARLYQYVRETGGVYGPLRPACPGGNIQSNLDVACAAKPVPTPSTQSFVDEFGATVVKPVTLAKADLPMALQPFMDDNGRFSCDPLGRSRRAQIEDYIEQMIGQSPFQLVE